MTAGVSSDVVRTVPEGAIHVRPARDQRDFQMVIAIRRRVFGDEQRLVGSDVVDEDDARSLQALAELEHQGSVLAVGTGRLTLAHRVDLYGREQAQIAWVATLPAWRGLGVASAVMQFLLDEADANLSPSVLVSAQRHAMGLYRRFGFATSGLPFESGGIPHQLMVRRLRAGAGTGV